MTHPHHVCTGREARTLNTAISLLFIIVYYIYMVIYILLYSLTFVLGLL